MAPQPYFEISAALGGIDGGEDEDGSGGGFFFSSGLVCFSNAGEDRRRVQGGRSDTDSPTGWRTVGYAYLLLLEDELVIYVVTFMGLKKIACPFYEAAWRLYSVVVVGRGANERECCRIETPHALPSFIVEMLA